MSNFDKTGKLPGGEFTETLIFLIHAVPGEPATDMKIKKQVFVDSHLWMALFKLSEKHYAKVGTGKE